MIWYKAFYGTWAITPPGVVSLEFGKYCYGTFDRREAFAKAKEVANKTGETVTVMWDIPRAGRGLEGHSEKVFPDKI